MSRSRALILHAPDRDDHGIDTTDSHFPELDIELEFFDKLGFECTADTPVNDEDFRNYVSDFLDEVQKDCKKEDSGLDCIAIFVSAHGVEKQTPNGIEHHLRLTDKTTVTKDGAGHTFVGVTEDLINPVLEKEELRHLKKIFIIASCRSREGVPRTLTVDQGVRIVLTDDVSEEYTLVEDQSLTEDNITEEEIDELQTGKTTKGYEGANVEDMAAAVRIPNLPDNCIVVYSTQSGRVSSTRGLGMSLIELKILDVMKDWEETEVPLLDFMGAVNKSLSQEVRNVRGGQTKSPSDVPISSVAEEFNVVERSKSDSNEGDHDTTESRQPRAETSTGPSTENEIAQGQQLRIQPSDVIKYCPCLSIVHNLSADIVFNKSEI